MPAKKGSGRDPKSGESHERHAHDDDADEGHDHGS
jgi:hypothetical protein